MVEVSGNTFSFGMGAELSDTPAALLSQQFPIGALPDEVFLELFKCYETHNIYYRWCSWPTLAQVCQRWRHVIASSPRYLGLQIFNLTGRSASGMMSGQPCGYTENVRYSWPLPSDNPDHPFSIAGSGKTIIWFVVF